MSNTSNSLLHTPLYELTRAQNARQIAFGGWEMALQFSGLKQEHTAVRERVGMFDISHMGKFRLQGKGLLKHLQSLVPSDLERLSPGRSQYTVLLNDRGGIIDDIIFYCLATDQDGEEHGLIIVNAATRARDKAWLQAHLEAAPVRLEDITQTKVLIAIQGPQAQSHLQPFVDTGLNPIPPFGHTETIIFGKSAFVARTGYTGEDGFEIMLGVEEGQELWRSLSESGVTPCGLGARDTLRLEAALALYGQDLDDTTTPLEAGLGWLVHWDKEDFKGRSVLEQQKKEGVPRKLVGIEMAGRYIARHGYPILWDGAQVGIVTSGTLSPTLEKAIALAYVPSNLARPGQPLQIEIRGNTHPAIVVKKPFYRRPQTKR